MRERVIDLALPLKREGMSYEAIAQKLSDQLNTRIPVSTLQRWLAPHFPPRSRRKAHPPAPKTTADIERMISEGSLGGSPTSRRDVIDALSEGHSISRVALLTGATYRNVRATARLLGLAQPRKYDPRTMQSRSVEWRDDVDMDRLIALFKEGYTWRAIHSSVRNPFGKAETLRAYCVRDYHDTFSRRQK
jgi:hypothetical protein